MAPGELIARKYRLIRQLGEGAMGVVWAAVNEATLRHVALKLMQNPSPEIRSRLLREARACGSLVQRHIVEVYDVGETEEGDPFLVMQLLSGETLDERIQRVGRLPPREAASIAVAMARALRVAHAAGIVHRDLKPANVILHREPDAPDEIVKVLDFGVSKTILGLEAGNTATGSLIGSPAYMSPEQVRASKHIDGRSDLWSLGVVLFEMLTGHRPFPSEAVYEVITEVVSAPIPKVASEVPAAAGLSRVVEACLEREVDRRVSSADELIQRLAPFAGDLVSTRDGAPSPLAGRAPLPSQGAGRLPSAHHSDPDEEDFIPTGVLDVRHLAQPSQATIALTRVVDVAAALESLDDEPKI